MAARPYRVFLTASAGRDLEALTKRPPAGNVVDRIDAAVLSLRDDPRPAGSKRLVGDGNGWRLRVGDYRVLYEIEDRAREVTVGRILHRSDAY